MLACVVNVMLLANWVEFQQPVSGLALPLRAPTSRLLPSPYPLPSPTDEAKAG